MNDSTTRLYGMADPSKPEAPAPNGMRGEGASDVEGPAYHRTVTPADQPAIEVEEVSGVASVEASRPAPVVPRPAPAAVATPSPPAPLPPAPSDLSPWPWIVVSLAVGFMAGRRLGGKAETKAAVPATGIRQDLDQVLV